MYMCTKQNLITLYGRNCNSKNVFWHFLVFAVCSFVVIVGQYWSNILVVLPKNISQLHRLPIMMEYFIDQEKYFYLILLHINAIICVGLAALLATGTMLITYFHHICGMFRIAWYEHRCMNKHNNSNCEQNLLHLNNMIYSKKFV